MKYCIKCGAALEDNQKFCNSCGARSSVENTADINNSVGYNNGSYNYVNNNAYYNNNGYNNGYNNVGYNNGFGGIIPNSMSKDILMILISSIIAIAAVVFIPIIGAYDYSVSFFDALEGGTIIRDALTVYMIILIPIVAILIGAIRKNKKITLIASIISIIAALFISIGFSDSHLDSGFGFWIALIGIVVSLIFSIKK